MARFGVNDADKYGGQGGGGYFRLAQNHETAKVRFLYRGIEDVEGFAVHEVEIDGKKRYVNCLREYGQPMDACPFCKKGMFTTVKYFVPLWNENTQKIETWERGKKFGQKLASLCARYPNLVSVPCEIERNGAPGDQQTTYEIYPGAPDNTTLEDFDEVPNPLGTHVLDKSVDEMQYFLDYNAFPDADNGIARRDSARTEHRADNNFRRTPSRRDSF